MGLAGPGPGCVASTTAVITEGAARVASVPNICVRPTTTPHNTAETRQKMRGTDREAEEKGEREEIEGNCEHDGRSRLNH